MISSIDAKRELLMEIDEKMKNGVEPTEKEKEQLQYTLNKLLSEEDHLYIFTEILQNLEKKIYTMTENGTLFDINDLDHQTFWKIQYCAQMCLDNHERQAQLNELAHESEQSHSQFKKQISEPLEKFKKDNVEDEDTNLTEYEKLRRQTLSQCSYSTFAKSKTQPYEKSVYSDNFQYKWKQNNRDDEISKKIIKIVAKCERERSGSVPLRTPDIIKGENREIDEIETDEDEDEEAVENDEEAVEKDEGETKANKGKVIAGEEVEDSDDIGSDDDDDDDDVILNELPKVKLSLRKN